MSLQPRSHASVIQHHGLCYHLLRRVVLRDAYQNNCEKLHAIPNWSKKMIQQLKFKITQVLDDWIGADVGTFGFSA